MIKIPSNFWIWAIFIGTIFFVGGQVALRKSFEPKIGIDYHSLYSGSCFSMMIGVLGAIVLLFLSILDPVHTKIYFSNDVVSGYPFLAGLLFFIGNSFWLYSISSKNPLGLIRILMAGWEMFLLLLVGFLLFKDKLTTIQIIGSLIIFAGISLIVYGESQ